MTEVGDHLLDHLFHSVELTERGVYLDDLVREDTRRARIVASVDLFGFSNCCQHAFARSGVRGGIVFAEREILLEREFILPGFLEAGRETAVDIHATSSPKSGPMSCAARYSETTSLEFILNPFKFFFTNYVVKNRPVAASLHSSSGKAISGHLQSCARIAPDCSDTLCYHSINVLLVRRSQTRIGSDVCAHTFASCRMCASPLIRTVLCLAACYRCASFPSTRDPRFSST